jgi:hypothetical protein
MRTAVLEQLYELGVENREHIRIPVWSGKMATEFSKRFEDTVNNVSETRISVEKTKVQLEGLDKRINGALEAMKDHMCEAEVWRRSILAIAVMVVVQIVAFAYLFGTISERIGNATATLGIVSEEYRQMRERVDDLRKEYRTLTRGGNDGK